MKNPKMFWLEDLKLWAEIIWQFPQNILGMIVMSVTRGRPTGRDYEYVAEYYEPFGVSLGDFIIFGKQKGSDISYKHEMGHRKQSLILGPLYLLLIGLPSLLGNLWDRFAHKSWNIEDRVRWYYIKLPWERWADVLGGVKR